MTIHNNDSTPTTTIDAQGQTFRSINNRGGGNCQIYAIAEGLLGNTSLLNKKKHRTLRQFLLRTLRKCAVEGLDMEKEYARHFFDETAHYKHEQSLDKFKAYFVRNKSYGNDVSLLGFSAAFQVRIEVYNYRIFPETPKNHTVPEPQSLYKVSLRADSVPEDAPVIHLMHTAYEPSVDPNQVSSHYTYLEPVADKDDKDDWAAFTGPETLLENTSLQLLPQLEPLLKRLREFGESHRGVVELMEKLQKKVDKVTPLKNDTQKTVPAATISIPPSPIEIVSTPTQSSPPRPTLVIPSDCTSPIYTLSPLSPQDQTFSSSVYYTASPGHQTLSPLQEPRAPTPTPSPQPSPQPSSQSSPQHSLQPSPLHSLQSSLQSSPQSSPRSSPITHVIHRITTDHPPTIIVRRSQRLGQRRPSGYTLRPQRPTKKQRM